MKTIEKDEQIFEIFESLKEAMETVKQYMDCTMEDIRIFIEYKDESIFFMTDTEKEGKFKTSNIKHIHINNGMTVQVYGKYEIQKNDVYEDWDIILKD